MDSAVERLRPVLLFGGTTEGRELAARLAGRGQRTILCVATDYGREVLEPELLANPCLDVRIGRMDAEEMRRLILEEELELVVDATHPYADQVTRNVRKACEKTGRECLRCLRPRSGEESSGDMGVRSGAESPEGGVVRVPSVQAAVEWLAARDGNILVTTGSKELATFSQLPDFATRVYARVLPTLPSLSACLDQGLSGRHIIAMQGPFSEETNRSQLAEFNCRFLVTKDTGDNGGFREKVRAAGEAGAVALVIDRPETERGLSAAQGLSADQVMERYEQWRRRQHV
ncbi:precorrin-6A reductase [Enterocloster lavalensis]|uniref:precorrin-6A reductase n=1 Tax=Enterocloster lavalensis TaxID=460384 RepID=UPI001D06CD9B|nr:precorrin-6A reductase [Enterocloster lavalensis]MCB6342265.1 precorrin-6A reductase [Enterocloster lavalensis]